MRLEAVDCSHYAAAAAAVKAFAPFMPSPPSSTTLSKPRSFDGNFPRFRRSSASNPDKICANPFFRIKGSAKSHGEEIGSFGKNKGDKKKLHCTTSRRDPFLETRPDFLEPMMLGIKPDPPADWPGRETDVWATVEQKAKRLEIPLSLRMIKKKLQSEEPAPTGGGGGRVSPAAQCSVRAAFASTAFIVVELQSHALSMREELCREDLEVITSKVQKEMHSSFAWLFQQVFSRTPLLMLGVMTLVADFGVYSVSRDFREVGPTRAPARFITSSSEFLNTAYRSNRLDDLAEAKLWESTVEYASKLGGLGVGGCMISPVWVGIEGDDDYAEYHRTDLIYQMNLSFEPGNSLLLCNYAQFLHLVARDYDRAEECFKKAMQATPPDAEALSRYANFLWAVRRDLSGAEEMFLQALALEPENSYYASKYANFLWSTGGEETCFPASTELQEL